VLAGRSDVEPLDATAALPEALRDARSAHLPEAAQLWPHLHGTDAMFLALLRRTA
jgi:16S rRNA (cytosine967-C5)-methyltransferase